MTQHVDKLTRGVDTGGGPQARGGRNVQHPAEAAPRHRPGYIPAYGVVDDPPPRVLTLHHPLRFVWEIALPSLCLAVLLAGWLLGLGQSILSFLATVILAGFLSGKFVSIWIDWARTMVKSATEEEHEHAPGAEESGGGK